MISSFFRRSEFVKNVVTLMTGTSIAQAIPIALSPVLTRIYSPDDFGLFALYSGIASILSVIATGRYELAIMLPEKEEDAAEIVKLSSLISCLISLTVLLIILIWGMEISVLLGNTGISNWLYLLPVSIFVAGLYQSLNYWFNRKKDFKRLAKNRVMQSSFTGLGQLPLGLLKVGGIGLLFGTLLGQMVTLVSLAKKTVKEDSNYFHRLEFNQLSKLASRYINFPKFDVPTTILNVGAVQAPNILFTTFFSASYAGFYYLTHKVLQAPVTLISTSVLDVFKEEASKAYRETGQAKLIFIKTFKWLLSISIIPSIFLFLVIDDLFVWVFGKDWQIAGDYAKILLPALCLRFIANPLSFMIYVAEKQIWNLLTMIGLACSVFLSFYLAEDHSGVIVNISITYVCYYIVHLILGACFAGIFKVRKV
ncbi:lipopolysaccharide biosynthesis protein [Echinicola soli]|uniref:Lipopolysaccharide biosynthesis protein n=1 Tax=Echinicola soli TaxID=2591634 RepID=A0A514CN53_9BACT|nr:lipopolysaccharide biosynthesis protein [Echinicola soli]QDH81246.1 lipopolysaccharide biosynthesis protein [Echinicola soli]